MLEDECAGAHHIFVYGSLMFDQVWSRVVQGSYSSVRATLTDHRRYVVQDETYPAVMPLPGSMVYGLLYMNVDQQDILRLDAFEGSQYLRDQAYVTDDQGKVWRAGFYRWLLPGKLINRDWDPEYFKAEDLLKFMNKYLGQSG